MTVQKGKTTASGSCCVAVYSGPACMCVKCVFMCSCVHVYVHPCVCGTRRTHCCVEGNSTRELLNVIVAAKIHIASISRMFQSGDLSQPMLN